MRSSARYSDKALSQSNLKTIDKGFAYTGNKEINTRCAVCLQPKRFNVSASFQPSESKSLTQELEMER